MIERLAIIGAGIAGLAQALLATRCGRQVTVFEQNDRARAASIRNFGMIWPVGQPLGPLHDLALRSQQLWREAASASGLWLNECGSVHLAHHHDELAVLEEFAAQSAADGTERTLLTVEQTLALAPAANPDGLCGGLFSATELGVDPPAAIGGLAAWLARDHAVRFRFSTAVNRIEAGAGPGDTAEVVLANGEILPFDRVVVCCGASLNRLFPVAMAGSGLRPCKLQMLRTVAQPAGWRIGPHLASGLTQRHYRNFADCPSIQRVRDRITRESPELDQWGIHVMASQNAAGEVILGDSHDYDQPFEPFDQALVDDLILRELRQVIRLRDWTIAARWHGVYARNPAGPVWQAEPLPNVHLWTGLGGSGMTMAFALAEQFWMENDKPGHERTASAGFSGK
jgi:D-hydroxyproline dehydrogenase subunit beta